MYNGINDMDEPRSTILITGATGGIGGTITCALAKSNHHILALGKDPLKLEALGKMLPENAFEGYTCDLTSTSEVLYTINAIKKKSLPIDWIVYSAGSISPHEKTGNGTTIRDEIFAVNLFSAMLLAEGLEQSISPTGGIILISSTSGIWGNSAFPYYSSSKGALNTYGLSLSKTWADTQKTCIVICPGPTNTPMREKIASDAKEQQSPEYVAQAVEEIITGKSPFKNGDLIVIRNTKTFKISTEVAI